MCGKYGMCVEQADGSCAVSVSLNANRVVFITGIHKVQFRSDYHNLFILWVARLSDNLSFRGES